MAGILICKILEIPEGLQSALPWAHKMCQVHPERHLGGVPGLGSMSYPVRIMLCLLITIDNSVKSLTAAIVQSRTHNKNLLQHFTKKISN